MKKPFFDLIIAVCVLVAATTACTRGTDTGHMDGRSSRQNQNVRQDDSTGTLILDAAAFIEEIPRGHYLADSDSLGGEWWFNNTGLIMATRTNYVLKVAVPDSGTYYLYARTKGSPKSTLRVAVGDRVIPENLANGPLTFKKAGVFQLQKGTTDVRLMRVEGTPILDVLVLSKHPHFSESDLKPYEYNADVTLLKTFPIPAPVNAIKFGDVTGDGKMDFVVLTEDFSAYMYDHDGTQLWSYQAEPSDRNKDEAPGVIWDLNQDGLAEVVHWRYLDGKEWLVVADGKTGEVKSKTEWPTTAPLPHPFNNYRVVVAKFGEGYPNHLVTFTDIGGTISVAAYDANLKQEWIRVENRAKDFLGHYIYPVDIDGDGIEEVAAGSLLLDAKGKEVWNRFDYFFDNHDHVDAYNFIDLDRDGEKELVAAHSEVGVAAFNARTGKMIWQNMAEHTQRLEAGNFLKGVPGPQVAVTARVYGNRRAGEQYLWGQVYWFDAQGNQLFKWPGGLLTGNPKFVKGDWKGDGNTVLFWDRFRMNDEGKGVLYFGERVYHAFDFMGGGAEEVITERPGGTMCVYGYSGADNSKTVQHDTEYVRKNIVNHTYY